MTATALVYKLEEVAKVTTEPASGSRWMGRARTTLLLTVFAAPLGFGAVLPLAWTCITLATCLALAFWMIGCLEQRRIAFCCSQLHQVAIGLVCFGILQLLTHKTVDPIGTREALLKVATDITIFFIASATVVNIPQRPGNRFGYAVSIYAFAIALFAIIQSFANPSQIYWAVTPRFGGYIFGPYVNHNHYAGLMEMLLPLMLAFLFSRSGDPLRPWLGFAALISYFSVVLSGSRAGLICVTLESLSLAAILLISRGIRRSTLAVLLFAAVAAVFLYSWLTPEYVAARLQSAIGRPEATYGERRNMALDSITIMRHFPVTGSGFGSFETIYPQFQSFVTDRQVDHAHNDYAEFLAEAGIPGAVLLIIALMSFGTCAWRNLISARWQIDWLRSGATVSCCGILLHSFCDFNLHIPANAAWFALCAAIATTRSLPEPHIA